MRRVLRNGLGLAAILGIASASAVLALDSRQPKPAVLLDQGWDAIQRQFYYYTSQGTFLMPAVWLDSLEAPDGSRFMGAENLTRYGFVYDAAASPKNPYGWPIGLTIDTDARNNGIAQAGFSCAACHNGQIDYRGTSIRIDGGQSNIDFTGFAGAMTAAVIATGTDAARRARFIERARALGYPGQRIEADFEAFFVRMRDRVSNPPAYIAGMTPPGPARLDAVNGIANAVFADALVVPGNARTANAPTNYPHLWDIWRFDWVQYNASARQPMGRNIIETMGTGQVQIADPRTGALLPEPERWRTNARVRNIHAIEMQLHGLKPPPWPEAVLGRIDRTRAAAGRALFAENCVACHGIKVIEGTANPVEWHVPLIPLARVGTDPNQAVNFARNRFDATKIGASSKTGVPEGLALVGARIKRQAYIDAGVPESEWPAFDGFGRPDDHSPAPCGYKARPLIGVWATAPYLHNGAVRTVFELLSETRPARFRFGSREYDPRRLGFTEADGPGVLTFDNSLPGNSNAGHWFTDDMARPGRIGRALTGRERYAIIEFLKATTPETYPTETVPQPGPMACADNRDWARDWPVTPPR